MPLAVVGMDEVPDGPPDRVRDEMAGDFLPRAVEERQATFPVEPEDDFANAFHHGAIALLAVAQGVTGGLRGRDRQLQPAAMAVEHQTDQADDRGKGPDSASPLRTRVAGPDSGWVNSTPRSP